MLGKELFKVESYVDLSADRYKSLILFYNPLIGNDAHYLYEFLCIKGNSYSFEELNKILNSLNISINSFEESIEKLNIYRLVKTLKKDNKYVFIIENPLSFDEFIEDDIFVRDFILKTSGLYYQSLIAECRTRSKHNGYEDISSKYDIKELSNWSSDNETFVNNKKETQYKIDSLFDINLFLSDISTNLLPLKYRNEENLSTIARLADLYNISYEKMRSFIPQVSKTDSNKFDLSMLTYLCQNAVAEYKYIEDGIYDIPCLLFLMNKQEGKQVTPFDKKIIYNLANEYKLKPSVINVLLEHALNECDNRLIEKYIYSIASDLNRNNIKTSKEALERLEKHTSKGKIVEKMEDYDSTKNPVFDDKQREMLLSRRNKK